MSNKVIEKIEKDQLKDHPEFRAGDTVEVKVKVTEGQRTRLQAFEGLVISVKKRGLNSAFIVRKISIEIFLTIKAEFCLLYTSPSPRDRG